LVRQCAASHGLRALALSVALFAATSAHARHALDIQVTSTTGVPLQYTAVLVGWSGDTPPTPSMIPPVMNQQNMQFEPHMLVVAQGSQVVFPNQDRTRHHVYSFSRAKTFDIKLYIGRPERPILFDTPGVVTLGCNIHDQMQAYIIVSNEPRWAVTDGTGHARIDDLPDSRIELTLWHPWMTSEQTRARRAVLPDQARVRIELDVTPPPAPPAGAGFSLQDRFDALAD